MERELLWTEKENFSRNWEGYGYHTLIRKSYSVFKKPNGVYLIISDLYTGKNRYSGKRYFRWENINVWGVKYTKTGLIQAYSLQRGRNCPPTWVWSNLSLDVSFYRQEYNVHFRQAIKDFFKIESMQDVYPVTKHYGILDYDGMPSPYRNAYRAETSREFVEKLFGKRNYRKDLLKAVGDPMSNRNALTVAYSFRGLVPIDWLVEFLRNTPEQPLAIDDWYALIRSDLKPILTQLTPRSWKRLLKDNFQDYMLAEIPVLYERNGFADENRDFSTWTELHDAVAVRRFETPRLKDKPIELTPVAKKLNGLQIETLKIVTATNTDQMLNWSKVMHNCISSYRSEAMQGRGVYAGVYEGDKLIANMEIKNRRLSQLLGPCNKNLDKNHRLKIEKALRAQEIDINNYWGKEGF